ncbi:MAG: hypothetical protein HKN99_12725 [Winogradskyella sp.]|nr:hypothetical protein [Winogradskyella sp.]MBT8376948.1 hypothetical protein [Bacteroidia bacterium]NNC46739.1 hypothetical protein [Winogradskyella sp.]NNF85155.1 hypothetical protein [Winogradskyella sp.]NNK39164.1 hypothetical protein [Winogradskyella sp.]
MKFLFFMLSFGALTNSCNSSKINTLSNTHNDPENVQNDISVTYTAMSRGDALFINISKDSISISEDRYMKDVEVYKCTKEDWQAISTLLKDIDYETLPKLKAPTDKRLYDGAPIAVLKIEYNNIAFSTPGFDHGFPPDKIQEIVNRMIAIKNTLKKE